MIRVNWIALYTLVRKEVWRFLRIWPQTVLPAAVTTSLYFLIFGSLVGRQIGQMGGIRYIDYIVPGIILMSVINNAYSNVVSSFYSAKFQHNVEELLVAPVPNWVILLGFTVGGVARGVLVGVVVAAIAQLFTEWLPADWVLAVGIALLTAALFSLAGFINAVYANSFDDISIIPNFVLTPLVYLGGVFYTIDLLSGVWRTVSLFNPILYMVNAFRYAYVGHSDVDVALAVQVILSVIVVLAAYSYGLLCRGVGLKS